MEGKSQMSEQEKYRINSHKYCENIVLSDECIIICKDKSGDVDNKTAELVCRLLNENEDKPKIDEIAKDIILRFLKQKLSQISKNPLSANVKKETIENAIKAIESLPTEE
jgi:RNase H-fold protein (predicted Holliday junction resolvase)